MQHLVYCKQQQALQWPKNEAIVMLCIHVYEHTRQRSLNTCRDLEDTCYGVITRGKNTYARKWRLEGHLLEGVFSRTCDMHKPISPRCTLCVTLFWSSSVDQLQFCIYQLSRGDSNLSTLHQKES